MFQFSTGFLCSQCGRGFVTSSGLNSHIKISHSNARPFACEKCPSKFKMKVDLTKHIDRIHTNKKYECNTCGRFMGSSYSLKMHISKSKTILLFSDHIMIMILFIGDIHEKTKLHKCTLCHRVLSSAKSLKTHFLTHTGEKRKRIYETY